MTYRYRIACVFVLGFFIDCINIFMSAVAMPSIAGALQVSRADVAWVANAYILGLTLVMPISPWLAGRWGPRGLLALSMLVFALAAWQCAGAATFAQLVAWRLLQGMAGGLLIPVGQALTFNLFQGADRARISTLVMVVALLAPALAPTLGGFIVDRGSWRLVFICNAPLALLAAALAWLWVREAADASVLRPDIKGLLLVSAALACVLLGLSLYGSPAALPCLAFGALWVALYIRHYRRTPHPIVDLGLLGNARLRTSVLVYQAIPGVFTGVNLLNIFYLQDTLRFSAQRTGQLMLLYAGGALVAMLGCGAAYARLGARRLFMLGMGMHSAGIALLALADSRADLPLLVLAYALMGLGGGIGANTAQTTALLDFSGQATQRASVIWNINRQVAFSLGAALMLVIYTASAQHLAAGQAYHFTFLIAALLGLLPLLQLTSLPVQKDCHAHHQA